LKCLRSEISRPSLHILIFVILSTFEQLLLFLSEYDAS